MTNDVPDHNLTPPDAFAPDPPSEDEIHLAVFDAVDGEMGMPDAMDVLRYFGALADAERSILYCNRSLTVYWGFLRDFGDHYKTVLHERKRSYADYPYADVKQRMMDKADKELAEIDKLLRA